MKLVIARILAVIMTVTALFGGGKLNVRLALTQPVAAGDRQIRYELVNDTPLKVSVEGEYRLEKLVDGEWTADWAPGGGVLVWNDLAAAVPPFGSLAFTAGLEESAGLTPGTYRLIKPYRTAFGAGEAEITFAV